MPVSPHTAAAHCSGPVRAHTLETHTPHICRLARSSQPFIAPSCPSCQGLQHSRALDRLDNGQVSLCACLRALALLRLSTTLRRLLRRQSGAPSLPQSTTIPDLHPPTSLLIFHLPSPKGETYQKQRPLLPAFFSSLLTKLTPTLPIQSVQYHLHISTPAPPGHARIASPPRPPESRLDKLRCLSYHMFNLTRCSRCHSPHGVPSYSTAVEPCPAHLVPEV